MSEPESVVAGIRRRAERSHRAYKVTVSSMILLALALVSLFLVGGVFPDRPIASLDSFASLVASLTGGLIVRLGAVLVGIYSVQIMFKFARYHIRVAQHLEAAADALQLCGDNTTKLPALQKAISPAAIDFGELPLSPSDKMFEFARELAKKIPASSK